MFSDENLKVFVAGDYAETDLVSVYHQTDPNSPVASYQAHYIRYGVDYPNETYLTEDFKINGSKADPSFIDYDVIGLHKKRTLSKGELTSVEYYRTYDNIAKTYFDLVVRETRTYTRDQIGMVQYRTQTTSWYCKDDSVGLIKNFTKYYSPQESIDEGITRRKNLIADAKLYTISTVGLQYGFDLMNTHAGEITLFENGYTAPLKDAIQSSTKPYLNDTIKATLVYILTI